MPRAKWGVKAALRVPPQRWLGGGAPSTRLESGVDFVRVTGDRRGGRRGRPGHVHRHQPARRPGRRHRTRRWPGDTGAGHGPAGGWPWRGTRAIPAGFLGLSLEYSAVSAYAGRDPSAVDPVFEQLIRNLTPGQRPVLRIGGDTTDWSWYPVPA